MIHWGTVIVDVDYASGKKPLRKTEVLYIDSLNFNIQSMQILRAASLILVFNEIPNKVVIIKLLPQGELEQMALVSETTQGCLTLDCKLLSSSTRLPSTRHA